MTEVDFAGRTIAVNGITLNVVIEGQGPDVLLLHGFPDDHDVWRLQIPALVAAGYRVIAPDLRGCGLSDAPSGKHAYAMTHLVADVIGLLDELRIEKVRLVGHDFGALIGWQLALQHPDRIERYTALATGHPFAYAKAPLEQKLKGWYVLLFQLPGVAEFALRRRNWWLFHKLVQFDAEEPNWVAKLERPGRLTAALDYYRANLKSVMFPKDPPHARIPVMGVWSAGDRFLAESQMIASEKLVDAPWRYERVDGANHWLQLTAPDRVNALLLDYLH